MATTSTLHAEGLRFDPGCLHIPNGQHKSARRLSRLLFLTMFKVAAPAAKVALATNVPNIMVAGMALALAHVAIVVVVLFVVATGAKAEYIDCISIAIELPCYVLRCRRCKGTCRRGITSVSHAEGPGFKSQCVHLCVLLKDNTKTCSTNCNN